MEEQERARQVVRETMAFVKRSTWYSSVKKTLAPPNPGASKVRRTPARCTDVGTSLDGLLVALGPLHAPF